MPNTTTPNVGLNKPAQGDTPWDATVNGNMDRLDAIFGATFTVPAMLVTALKATLVTQYNSLATAGQGIVPIYAVTAQKSESAADTNVLTFTPPAATGTYRITFTMSITAANAATLGWTITYKDSNGNAQTPTNLPLFQQGTAAPALTFTTSGTGNYSGDIKVDTDNSATAIVVKLTFSGTSFTAKVTAIVERLV